MALNIKKLENINHPDFLEHTRTTEIKFNIEHSQIDPQKHEREDRPKDHNLDYEKILLKINVIFK
jgi:hypothetical protein